MAHIKKIRSYRTPSEKEQRRRVEQAVRGFRAKMLSGGPEGATGPIRVKHVVWRNFLWANDTFALACAACYGIDFTKLSPQEWVLGLNVAADQLCLIRLTPGGNILTIHARVAGGVLDSLDDCSAVFREPIVFAGSAKTFALAKGDALKELLVGLREMGDLKAANAFIGDLVAHVEKAARAAAGGR